MDVVLAVLRPKQSQATQSQSYRPQLYEILLLDSKTPQGEKVKPAKYLPMLPMKTVEEEPRELVLTQVYRLTGIKGERALQVQWNQDVPGSLRESLSQFCLFFVPVSLNDKVNKKFVEQAQNTPGFYPLEYVNEALANGSVHFPSPTRTFLSHLESWLRDKHQRSTAIECMFRPRAEFRIHLTVHNPAFIPSRITPEGEGASSSKVAQLPPKIQLTANEALAKMLAIEKCDTVVMNPLFGSGLPYKTKVNSFEVNDHWLRMPNYRNISIPSPPPNNPSASRWREKFPLHAFAAAGDKEEVGILLKKGYSPSETDSNSLAPIHYAAWYGCISVVEQLISAGCSPNTVDGENSTPLHMAAKKGNVQLAQCLLRRIDIDLNIRDKDGKRAIDVCSTVHNRTSRHEQVEQLIKDAAQRPNLSIEVFLMDNSSKSLQLSSGYKTTVQQLNEQMMKEFNLPMKYSDIFTLWICSKSLELQLKLEHEVVKELQQWHTRSVNMLTEARNPSEEEPSLKWRRNVKVSVDKEKQVQHPKALDLLFHEAYYNYINGLYPCKDRDIVTFASIIFAIQHHGTGSVKSVLSTLNMGQLKEMIPAASLRNNQLSHWIKQISKEYNNVKDIPQQQLKSHFLSICQRLMVYGSAFFTGNITSHQRKSSIPSAPCFVGVNDLGIHIINIQTKQMVESLEYGEIVWKHIFERSLLEVTLIKPESRDGRSPRGLASRGVYEIRTRQAGLIDHLMQQLKRMHGDNVVR
ncbi:krev interaction trapped protein 1 [Aplysia californica]|uniref:Krev interaction trapped protein 1 n=1 Tax=Aplysia californica TaxID=6500 RepID=A0ABM0JCJ7_APLCA|nr:krev interaction trapped protein 1 [Aplysia californica]